METEDFIRRLAADAAEPRRPIRALQSRLLHVLLAAGGGVVLVTTLAWGPRPDLASALASPAGLSKFGLVLGIGLIAFALVIHSAEPGREAAVRGGLLTLLVWVAGLTFLAGSALLRREAVPAECLLSIFVLAVLPLAALLSVLRAGASTRPVVTGWLAGLLAGAAAAFGFAFCCPMDSVIDVVTWYSTAMGCVGIVGALAGARVLSW